MFFIFPWSTLYSSANDVNSSPTDFVEEGRNVDFCREGRGCGLLSVTSAVAEGVG
jgi:hypothetical protein